MTTVISSPFKTGSIEFSREAVLRDFRIGMRSRHVSVLGRKEVLSGKAKFGIFGAGKEVAQLAMAYAFERGDYRCGYYRDQTLMMALGVLSAEQFFAQLYAHADPRHEPFFAGRSMNGHFASRLIDADGQWKNSIDEYNSAADLSPTASQMPKLVGLALASKLYREVDGLADAVPGFSDDGSEIAFGTIGNASCAEGLFWESINAIGVLQAPALVSIWDDGYGISVPNQFQMTKGSVSAVLQGFRRRVGGRPGFDLHTVPGWDYARLCEVYLRTSQNMRKDQVPVVLHVTELTQPLGHSTSGSHERYKPAERLEWEERWDCLRKMRQWIEREGLATSEELDAIVLEEERFVETARDNARAAYRAPLEQMQKEFEALAVAVSSESGLENAIAPVLKSLGRKRYAIRRDMLAAATEVLIATRDHRGAARDRLLAWRKAEQDDGRERYSSALYLDGSGSALEVPVIAPTYQDDENGKPRMLAGFEIFNNCFDAALERMPHLFAMGEDVGRLGDVNQGFQNLQAKYGLHRVTDTGIREATILGQAIGMSLRGLRPICEIQYLDYILYAIQLMSDELSTLHWRTRGGQRAPVIIRTRGHRLEGIWHSGSPMAAIVHLCRGLRVCVPRDAVQAAGMYNTLLAAEDPALVVEVLNGYRKKLPVPENLSDFTVALGVPETLREGSDVTIVTYGACVEICLEAAEALAGLGVECEVIDVQTLLPFDVHGRIAAAVERTGRVVFVDEDVPGGTTAYMTHQVLEKGGAFWHLDAEPRTISGQEHRPAYGSDGDYFSKPSADSVIEEVYALMREGAPSDFPAVF